MNQFVDSMKLFAAAGAGSGVAGAISHDQIMTWCGAGVAVGSALATSAVAAYHKFREARRVEDSKDRRRQLDDIRMLSRVQSELEARIGRAELAARKLAEQVEHASCRYPNADGSARCTVTRKCSPDCNPRAPKP